MKFLIVGGFLGSGKTTALIWLGKYYSETGKRVSIIVNEIGDIGIDGYVIEKFGLNTIEITAGCICCSLKMSMRETIKTMKDKYNPDLIIIEPTGVAYPGAVRQEIKLMNTDECEIMPLVTLFDGSRFKQIMKEMKQFSAGQIKDADIVAVSKADLIEPIMIPVIEESIRQINPRAYVTTLSTKDEESFKNLIHMIERPDIQKKFDEKETSALRLNSVKMSEIKPLVKAYGFKNTEAVMNLSQKKAECIVNRIGNNIKKTITDQNPEFIGHFKMFLYQDGKIYRLNITSSQDNPDVSVTDSGESQTEKNDTELKIFIAVSGFNPDRAEKDVETIILNELKKYSAFEKK